MDLRHPLGTFVEEEPGQLLHQLHVPVHAVQGRGEVEGRGPGAGRGSAAAGSAAVAGTRRSRTSKSSWGRSGLET